MLALSTTLTVLINNATKNMGISQDINIMLAPYKSNLLTAVIKNHQCQLFYKHFIVSMAK